MGAGKSSMPIRSLSAVMVSSLRTSFSSSRMLPFQRYRWRASSASAVSFLRDEPDAAAQRPVLALESPVDKFRFHGRELYWLCHGKISEVSVAWPQLDKLAKSSKAVSGTSRNITSLRKLLATHA